MSVTADSIASLVLQQFEALPAKRKPLVRDNGIHEWVPLSGIVAEDRNGKLQCLSIATGMKCLPAAKLRLAHGNALHDWHAEVLAIRAFNRFVLDEAARLARSSSSPSSSSSLSPSSGSGSGADSDFLRRRSPAELQSTAAAGQQQPWHAQPFAWRDDVKLHMYCSEAPCGDASMELTMAAQADATPWDVPVSISTTTAAAAAASSTEGMTDAQQHPHLPGRAYFSHLGLVRRKPARGDAPPTLSKSCSDKLALKQCTSLLSALTCLLVCPARAYLHTLVLPGSQHSPAGYVRAFSAAGRMRPVADRAGAAWPGGYRFRPFGVEVTMGPEFVFSKRSVAARAGEGGRTAASNLAVAWTASGLEEGTLGGVLQGRKAFDPRGASFASRRKQWAVAAEAAALLGGIEELAELREALAAARNYRDVKGSRLLEARNIVMGEVKAEALSGWVQNKGDDDFSL